MRLSFAQARLLWWLLFIGLFSPSIYIVLAVFQNWLGAEPAKALVEFLGDTAFIVLLLTLSLSPLSRVTWLPSLLRYRRMVGLYAFFYATVHVASYGLFLVDWQNFIEDFYKRPYVMVGALAFLILLLLAVTSPKVMLRKLGKRWKSIHRLIYPASICVLVHVIWQTRSDYAAALWFGVALSLLLLFRWRYFVNFASKLSAK